MRVLFAIHGPLYGGAHNELLVAHPELRAHGWEPLALTTDQPGTGIARLRAGGVETIPIPLHRLRASIDPRPHLRLAARFAPEVRAIRRILRARRVDLVQAHGVINPHAALAAHLEGVAVCWHLLDMNAPGPLRRGLMPLVLRLADSVTAVGHAVAAAHPGTERLGERLVITSPPVDLQRFRPHAGRAAAARAELGIPGSGLAVGTVGNLFANKGHLLLIEAAGRLVERFPELTVRILGSASAAHPDYARSVAEEIARRGLDGRAAVVDPGTRVAELLPAFDVFALPSFSEGMPTTVLEAMACGLPVVSSDVGSVRELVSEGQSGLLVPPGDPDALTGALGRLLADAQLREEMGSNGQARADARFGLERTVSERLRAYDLALAHRRARARS